MKGSRALGLIAVSATASLPLLASAPLGAAAASHPDTSHAAIQRILERDSAAPRTAAARHRLVASAKTKTTRLVSAGGKTAKSPGVTAPWLPKGCRLVEIGPANAGYAQAQMCAVPKGFRLRRGYMLVRGSLKPSVHTSSGASG